MQRDDLLQHWTSAWTGGLWAAPWSKGLEDLTPQQAAWQPTSIKGEHRHSIWQIVNHMIFWREHDLQLLAGKKISNEEKQRLTFQPTPEPAEATPGNWRATVERFAQTHQ